MPTINQTRLKAGDRLNICNGQQAAVRHRVSFGDAGEVVVTLHPGAELTIVAGNTGTVNVYIEETLPTGLKSV